MLRIIVVAIIAAMSSANAPAGDVYSAWADTGIHLMISDNGTPEDFDDDFICDWETNRIFTVTVHD